MPVVVVVVVDIRSGGGRRCCQHWKDVIVIVVVFTWKTVVIVWVDSDQTYVLCPQSTNSQLMVSLSWPKQNFGSADCVSTHLA